MSNSDSEDDDFNFQSAVNFDEQQEEREAMISNDHHFKILSDICDSFYDNLQTGFYHMKALHIKQAAVELLSRFEGRVPCDIDELTSLPGVGRKTANVIRSHIYNEPSIVVDTHVKRISKLLGLTDTLDPEKAEFELMKILPKDHWIAWNTQIIRHGRTVCKSGRPDCASCFLREVCKSSKTR